MPRSIIKLFGPLWASGLLFGCTWALGDFSVGPTGVADGPDARAPYDATFVEGSTDRDQASAATPDRREVGASLDGGGSSEGSGASTILDASCVSPTDIHNCGACGHDCASLPNVFTTSVACVGGRCVYQCAPGFADCVDAGAGCAADRSQSPNCGGCGTTCTGPSSACAPTANASGFACVSTCPATSPSLCMGACVDEQTSAGACGGCGPAYACASGRACRGGRCVGPALSILPTQFVFGATAVGAASGTQSFVVSNTGDGASAALTVTVGGANANEFVIAADPCSGSALAAGASCTVSVQFVPKARGSKAASLDIQGGQPFAALTAIASDTVPLNVTKSGSGGGTVSGDRIACGAACSEQVVRSTDANPMITLAATPDSASIFSGWSGACSGTSATCVVTMSQAQTVNAQFDVRPCSSGTTQCSGPDLQLCTGGQWGAPAACPGGQTCMGGQCACLAGAPDTCGGTCTNLQADGNNCGACGHSCLGGACAAGMCQPFVITPLPAGSTGWSMALDAVNVYFATFQGGLYSCPKTGCATASTLTTALNSPDSLLYDGMSNHIFVADTNNSAVEAYSTSGALISQLTGQAFPFWLSADTTAVYLGLSWGIERLSRNGLAPSPVAANVPSTVLSVAVDAASATLYGATASAIIEASTTSTGAWTYFAGTDTHPQLNVQQVIVSGSSVYWVAFGNNDGMHTDGGIFSCPKSGCAQPTPIPGAQSLREAICILPDATDLYYVASSTLYRCPFGGCGGGATQLASGVGPLQASSCAQDATSFYFLNATSGGGVQRLAK